MHRTHHEGVNDQVVIAEPPEVDIFDDCGVRRLCELQAGCKGREDPKCAEVEELHGSSGAIDPLLKPHGPAAGSTIKENHAPDDTSNRTANHMHCQRTSHSAHD